MHEGPPFPDAATNPQFAPVHQFHLGLWFDSANAARAAGCTGEELVRTPFNGEHNGARLVVAGADWSLAGRFLRRPHLVECEQK